MIAAILFAILAATPEAPALSLPTAGLRVLPPTMGGAWTVEAGTTTTVSAFKRDDAAVDLVRWHAADARDSYIAVWRPRPGKCWSLLAEARSHPEGVAPALQWPQAFDTVAASADALAIDVGCSQEGEALGLLPLAAMVVMPGDAPESERGIAGQFLEALAAAEDADMDAVRGKLEAAAPAKPPAPVALSTPGLREEPVHSTLIAQGAFSGATLDGLRKPRNFMGSVYVGMAARTPATKYGFAGAGIELTGQTDTAPYQWSIGPTVRVGGGLWFDGDAPVPIVYGHVRVTPFAADRTAKRIDFPGDPGRGEADGHGVRIGLGVTSPAWNLIILSGGSATGSPDSAGGALLCLAALLVNHGELTWERYVEPGYRSYTSVGWRVGVGF